MSITTKVEDIFDDIVKKKLLEVSRRQQKYLLYIYLFLSSVCCFLAFWGGLNKPSLHYWLIGIMLIPIISYFFLQKYHYFHWVWYYLLSNFFIFLGGFLANSSLLALPEVFIVLAAAGYVFIHLFVIAPIAFILAESLVALILFFWIQKEQLTGTHSIFDVFLILGSIVVAAFTAIQKYQMTKREVVAQTIIYHSNQKLHQQQQEIVEQNQKIIEKEHNLRGIVDNSNMAIWLVDKHYRLIEFNEKFRQYMWVTYQEEVRYGENVFDVIQKHSSMLFWKERLEKAFQGEKQTYIDYYPKFNHNYIQIDIFPIWFEQKIQSVSILGKNITKQKNAEMTIQHNQMLLSSISKNIREGIYRSNEKELIYANEAFTELFGYQENEVFYIKPSDFYADAESREEVINQVREAGFIHNKEVLFKKKDGSTFWALMSLIAQKDSEGNIYFDGAIRDITQIKEIKEQIEIQNQELKKINNELDRFVYSASHDLKAPLASILGLINVAKMEQEPSLLYGYMNMIQEAIIKLDNFIKDIIDYSRNARTELSYELIDIKSFIEDIYKNLDYLDNAHKIDRQVEIQEEVGFVTDTKRLSVIFNNLISNAINYHNFQQEHPWIKIHFLVQAKEALISISDNGLGIAEEHIPKIFNMFYRASYDSKGSGLGLYIVKEAVSKLGGTIAVESQKNRGTIFTIKIPNHTFENIQDQDHHNNLKENVYLES